MTAAQGWITIALLITITILLIGITLERAHHPQPTPLKPRARPPAPPPAPLKPRARPPAPPPAPRPATTEDVITGITEHFNTTRKDLTGPSRTQPLITYRQIAMRLARELTGESYPQIGHAFGERNHSTVINACHQAGTMHVEDVRETILACWQRQGITPTAERR